MVNGADATVLIAVDNRITSRRLKSVMSNKGFKVQICEDGDKAVDEYVKIRPNIIFLGIDLPTLDGHIAALEIRESDRNARIVFVSSRTRKNKAEDAAFSSGAVATLTTPISKSDIERNWELIHGTIPEAPGLADLDKLYPDLDKLEKKEPTSPTIATEIINQNLPIPPQFPEIPIPHTTQAKPKKRKLKLLLILITMSISTIAVLIGTGIIA